MPNQNVMQIAAERRRSLRPQAKRAYRKYGDQAYDLIRQLGGPTQAEHDRAFELLSRMGEFVVEEMLEAVDDPTLNPTAVEEIISLLGATGDERAREPLWRFLQDNLDDPDRVSTAALSLAGMGDERVLPYLREGLAADDTELVANAVAGMIMLGELEDVQRLRELHRRHRTHREIRFGIANAILTILGETDQQTFNRKLDEIQASFVDRYLWEDIWALLESSFGDRPPIH